MKRFIMIILAAALAAAAVSCTAGGKSNEKGTFTVGFDKEFPPMGFVSEGGSYVGFDLDLAGEVAKRLNLELKLQPIDWSAKNFELESGNVDCIWNGFTINGREDEYTWTSPYMNNNQIVVVNADSEISSFKDLSGKIVAVQDDSSALTAIENNADFKGLIGEIVKTETNLGALMELESGAVDAVVMDEIVARYNIEKQGGNYKVLDEVVGAEQFGVGFKLGNTELCEKVESALLKMVEDGSMARISESWFGKDITTIGKQ
ncbi:MAG: Glutamine-binding periplasmic protein precursor [Firmicutes bacterium ADurb.Bin182]|nr:MAG: Glutamine-binding periplasmic protein precursor [Firmicutes bacterium ADurb.Bin182]